MSKFLQALAALLPTGFAWPRDPDSVLMRVLRAVAALFWEHHQFVLAAVRQWWPHNATNRLAEWEAAVGLPDPCFGSELGEAERRDLVLARLRGLELPYFDSSPAATGVIELICLTYGYVVTVTYDTLFRIDRDGVCDRLGSPGELIVDMHTMCEQMACDTDGVDHRLIECTKPPEALMCLLQRIVHARFHINLMIDGEQVGAC